MRTKHTPGPWIADSEKLCIYADGNSRSGGFIVAEVAEYDEREETTANARLIAAAPEMVKAGNALADEMRELLDYHNDEYAQAALEEWDALIAEATGEAK